MPFTSDLIKITIRFNWFEEPVIFSHYHKATGAAFLTANPVGVGEAYWNHVKTAWRALSPINSGSVFKSVLVEEIGGGQSFGEYGVPTVEQTGTRANPPTEVLPPWMAIGVKYLVGTRLTRPGQQRVPFLYEGDIAGKVVQPSFAALVDTLADLYDTDMTLGAPIATGVLRMQVVRIIPTSPPTVAARQDVVGHVTNSLVTTQLTRRGRG